MNKLSNSKNYIKIYFWQSIALFLRFLSLFIVVPFLSSEPQVYGVYSVCISVLIFLNYADLGFLNSSTKYATESYARSNREEEVDFIGFGVFILLSFSILISFFFIFCSFNPDFLVDGLNSSNVREIASSLLLILAVFTPLIALQRMASIIFNIRMHGYVNKIVSIISSLISIISTFYFFSNGKYMIVEYFLFYQSINFISTIAMLLIAQKKYDYNLIVLFKKIRFNNKIYLKSKKLAFSGLFTMVAWVLFYELDQIVIGSFLGVTKVAVFAISIMFATLFRSIFSIIFTPFNVRANHYVGDYDEEGLKNFIRRILIFTAPITILPSVAISIVSKPLILSWVGVDYIESVPLAQLFALLFSMSFITYTATSYIVSKEMIKDMYFIAALMPIVYWLGVYLSYRYVDLISFPIFKLIAVFLSVIYCIHVLKKNLKFSNRFLIRNVFTPVLIPVIYLVLMLNIVINYFPENKSNLNFLIVILVTSFIIITSFILQYIISKNFKLSVNNLIKDIKK